MTDDRCDDDFLVNDENPESRVLRHVRCTGKVGDDIFFQISPATTTIMAKHATYCTRSSAADRLQEP